MGGGFPAPDAGEGGLDFLPEAGDQFPVGGDEGLLGFDLGHDGALRGGQGQSPEAMSAWGIAPGSRTKRIKG